MALFSSRLLFVFLIVPMLGTISGSQAQTAGKPRLLVLTDIGGDPDDIQSLRRLLVYANEFRIEGLIASAVGNPRYRTADFDGYFVNDSIIHMAIDDYEKVQPYLAKHADGFPKASELHEKTKAGTARREVAPGMSTPGSELIIKAVDSSDEVLNVAVWGGAHDLGQALLDVKTRRSDAELKTFVSKLVVFAIADQHTRQPEEPGSGHWIVKNFRNLRYIQSGAINVFAASFRGMYQNDAAGHGKSPVPLVKPGIEKLNTTEWLRENVLAWGPLGAGYPSEVRQNPGTERNTRGVKEGDTPSWFFFLENGLGNPEFPEWGGWGGRYVHHVGNFYSDAQDHHWSGSREASVKTKWTVARWREAYQNDFAARMRWCMNEYDKANHHPRAVLNGDESKKIISLTAKPGDVISLNAAGSKDPDGNALSFRWWIYTDVSTADAVLKDAEKTKSRLIVSESTGPGQVHVILEVKDNGQPSLTSYRRVVVNVQGNE
jgi:hypothetical protein